MFFSLNIASGCVLCFLFKKVCEQLRDRETRGVRTSGDRPVSLLPFGHHPFQRLPSLLARGA